MSTVVVVTGATSGVGRATVRAFAACGADVALIARGAEGLVATAKEVRAAGRRVVALPADVADADEVDAAAARAEAELGDIDVWVNNAMVSAFAPVAELTAAEIRRVTEVTYLGTVHGTLAALDRMRARNRGTIVQVGSGLAFRSIPLQGAYCGAKHAVEGFSEALRCELLHDASNVRVSRVHLPAVNTPHFEWVRTRLPGRPRPVAPVFAPEVAARAIVWAATHAPRSMKVGWPTVRAVYANTVAAGLLDRYLAKVGYASQQSDDIVESTRPDNLFTPVEGDRGAHGRFDAESRTSSWHLAARLAAGTAVRPLRVLRGRELS